MTPKGFAYAELTLKIKIQVLKTFFKHLDFSMGKPNGLSLDDSEGRCQSRKLMLQLGCHLFSFVLLQVQFSISHQFPDLVLNEVGELRHVVLVGSEVEEVEDRAG